MPKVTLGWSCNFRLPSHCPKHFFPTLSQEQVRSPVCKGEDEDKTLEKIRPVFNMTPPDNVFSRYNRKRTRRGRGWGGSISCLAPVCCAAVGLGVHKDQLSLTSDRKSFILRQRQTARPLKRPTLRVYSNMCEVRIIIQTSL